MTFYPVPDPEYPQPDLISPLPAEDPTAADAMPDQLDDTDNDPDDEPLDAAQVPDIAP